MVGLTKRSFAAVAVKADSLGAMPALDALLISDVTPDGCHVIMAVHSPAGGQTIILDGKPIGEEPEICGLAVSPNGAHYAYAAKDKIGFHIISDRVTGNDEYAGGLGFDHLVKIHFLQFQYSPDSRHFGFIASDEKDYFTVVDGKAEPHFHSIATPLIFSADSKHWAYVGRDENGDCTLVMDGRKGKIYSGGLVLSMTFTPQDDLAFQAPIDPHNDGIVINGKIVGKINMASEIAFSDDGKHYAYGDSRRKGKDDTALVVDGQPKTLESDPATEYPPILQYVVLSHDGKNLAYIRSDAIGERVGGDSRTPVPFDPAKGAIIGDRYAKSRVVWNDSAGPILDWVYQLYFSPDGAQIAYPARDGGKWQIITGSPPATISRSPVYEMVAPRLVFSADSKHMAYAARKDGKWMMVLDGQEITEYTPLHDRFQEDSDPYPPFSGFRFSFDADNSLNFIASKDGSLLRVHATPPLATAQSQPTK